jgi:hypothetical protein
MADEPERKGRPAVMLISVRCAWGGKEHQEEQLAKEAE